MLYDTRAGRHRAAVRYSPLAELTLIARSAGQGGAKASAVLAASGGLVAAFALPAHATPEVAAADSVAPAAVASVAETARAAEPAVAVRAPAVIAPAPLAPVGAPVAGIEGVTVVAKPVPVVRTTSPQRTTTTTTARASRSGAARVLSTTPQSSSEVVTIARTLLGIPYVYGGSTPDGFDCSGFTQYVFGKAGVSIPRTASAQQDAATRVSDPKPGDLVFFGSPAWHVGIYTGNGMMIDSPREGKSTSERPIFSGVSGYGRF